MTKVLVGLYEEPERPQNAIDYIKRYIGAPQNVDVEGLKRENDMLKAEVERLRGLGGNGKGTTTPNATSAGKGTGSGGNTGS